MTSRSPSIYDGMLFRMLLFPFKLGFALVLVFTGLLMVAWTVDWVCVAYVWPGRIEGLRQLLAAEMVAGIELAARQGESASSVLESANWLYGIVFETTGLHEMGQQFTGSGGLAVADSVVRDAWVARHEALKTAMVGVQLLGLRAGTATYVLPIGALLYAAGAAEGLRQRSIRRARVAQESASLYHRAKLGQAGVLVFGTIAMLIWPTPVAWSLSAVAFGLMIAVVAAWQCRYFRRRI